MTVPLASLPLTGRPSAPPTTPEGGRGGAEEVRSPLPPGAVSAAEAELTAALPLRWWAAALPRPLERRFAAQWAAEQYPQFLPITVIGVLAFLALTAGGDQPSGHAATALTALRWSIVAFTGLFLVVRAISHRQGQHIPPSTWSWCYATGSTAMAVYTALLNRALPTDVESVRCSAILLIFLSTSLVARLPLGLCVISGVTSVGLYAAAVSPLGSSARAVVLSNLVLFVMSFTIAARWALDRSQRAAWVLHELDVVRRADLTAGSEALRQLGLHDPLTGLGNRRQLDATMCDADLSRQALLVVAVDIDHFKAYNDCYGHLGGDSCLRAVAAALQDAAERLGGVATRVGGEEFTLVLPDAGPGTGHDAAGAVCAAVRALQLPHGTSRCSDVVTVSVGVSTLRPDRGGARADEVSEVLLAADRALYQAKNGGRDRWVLATSSGDDARAAEPTVHQVVPDPVPQQAERPVRSRRKRGRLTAEAVEQYWAQSPSVLARRVRALAIAFAPIVVLNAVANAHLFPDVARRVVVGVAVVELVSVVWFLISSRWQLSWRWRVRPLAAVVAALGLVALWGVHESRAPLATVPLLALVLLPMFLAFVVGVPFRTTALVWALLFAGALAVSHPLGDMQTSLAANVVKTDAFAGLYAILGAHLLQQSRYLEFSLGLREREMQEALRAQEADLEVLATRDPLTGLTNRRAFEHFLARAQKDAAAIGAPVALLLLDVDHFKRYNDTAGHPAGDEVLRRLGGTFAAWAEATCDHLPVWTGPPASLASRWGGEEFGVLLPGVSAPEALVMAEQVRRAVADLDLPHPCSPVAERVTVSIGVAAVASTGDAPTPAEARTQLLTEADHALYRAKAGGRDQVSA